MMYKKMHKYVFSCHAQSHKRIHKKSFDFIFHDLYMFHIRILKAALRS